MDLFASANSATSAVSNIRGRPASHKGQEPNGQGQRRGSVGEQPIFEVDLLDKRGAEQGGSRGEQRTEPWMAGHAGHRSLAVAAERAALGLLADVVGEARERGGDDVRLGADVDQ